MKLFPGKCVVVLILSELNRQTSAGLCGRSGLRLQKEETGGDINGVNINKDNKRVKFSRSWAHIKRGALKCA